MEGDFRVGEWLVQPKNNTITNGSDCIHLEPKVMDVLVHLAQHANDVLSKEQIIRAIWPDTFVTDDVLIHAVSELRRAFQDDARNPKVIQTIPKRGYQLVARVRFLKDRPNWRLGAAAGVLLVLSLTVVLTWIWYPRDPSGEPIDSIAVLPFTCTTEDEETQSLAFALASSVGSSLSRLEGLKTKPAAGLMRYLGQVIDPQTVSDELDVSAIFMGSVARFGEVFSVTVSLIDGREGNQIWGDTYSRNMNELFEMEQEIPWQVAEALNIPLTQAQSESLVQRGTDSPDAYRAFNRGKYRRSLWFRDNLEKNIYEAIGHWRRAVEIDPSYQEAYWELAYSYFFLVVRRAAGPEEYCETARTYFEKVVETGPLTVLGHCARGRVLWSYDQKWEEAESEFRKAAQLDPSIETDYGRAAEVRRLSYLEWMGRREEFLSLAESELEHIDPISPGQHLVLAYRFFWHGDWNKALRMSQETIALESDQDLHSMHWLRSICYDRLGMDQKAFEAILAMVDDEQQIAEIQRAFDERGLAGVRPYRFEELRRDRALPKAYCAMGYAQAGEIDKALDCLEQMWSLPLEGWEHAPSNRLYDPLRSHPRFAQLLRRQKLPEEAIQRHLARK